MGQVTGALRGNQLPGGDSDPRLIAQAKGIGATVDPRTGWWIDQKDGHHIGQQEADQRTVAMGNAETYDRQRAGWGNQLFDRNRDATGNFLKNIAPLAAFIPGIGPFAAAALAGLGSAAGTALVPGTNFGDILKGGASGAAMGSGLNAASGAFGAAGQAGGGLGSQLGQGLKAGMAGYQAGPSNAIKGVAGSAGGLPGVSALTNLGSSISNSPLGRGVSDLGSSLGDLGKGIAGGIGNAVGSVGGAVGLPGLNPVQLAGLVQAAQLSQKSGNFADQAAHIGDQAWQAGAPLRTAGSAGMLNPQAPDLSSLAAMSAKGQGIQAPQLPGLMTPGQIPGNPFAPRPGATPPQGLPGIQPVTPPALTGNI